MRRSEGRVGGWVSLVAVLIGGCSGPNAVVGGNHDELGAGGAPMVSGSETGSTNGRAEGEEPLGTVCVPSLELDPRMGGIGLDVVQVDDASSSCASGVCLVQRFRGRVSCPLGNADGRPCFVPGTNTLVTAPVEAQLVSRPPSLGATCSCRCAGPGPGPFCDCGAAQECVPLVDELGVGDDEYAGSYCVPRGATDGPPPSDTEPSCAEFPEQCEGDRPY